MAGPETALQLPRVRSTNSTNASMLSRGPGLEGRRHRGVFHHGEDGAFPLVACAEQAFHRHVAQAARGNIGDAQQADVVVRVQETLEVSEEILDLAPVEKALTADEMITHAGLAQRGFQRTRLLVGAEENRAVRPGHALRQPLVFDLGRRLPAPRPRRRHRCAAGSSRPSPFCDQSFLPRRRTLCLMMALAALRMVLVVR